MKKRLFRSLLFFTVGIMFLSAFEGVLQASAAVISGTGVSFSVEGYKITSDLEDSDKDDSTQKNYQESDLEDCKYSKSLFQSAEWTDKTTGEATINIHYEADFEDIEIRSLYVFTTCTGHGFTEETAINNILQLLEYNEYVDIIMIGACNRVSIIDDESNSTFAADAAAASMFSVRASDFDLTDTDGSKAMIKKLLETYSTKDFEEIEYAYGLGRNGTGTGEVEVLYDEIDIEDYPFTFRSYKGDPGETYYSAAEFVLTFGSQRHAGEVFSLYYIARYIDIIENERELDFGTTVQAIFNSFDAYSTANRSVNTSDFPTDVLHANLLEYVGLDMTSEMMSLFDMRSSENGEKCWYALSVMEEYSSGGRYIALIPGDGEDIYDFSRQDYSGRETPTINAILYSLALIAPTDEVLDNEADVREEISRWIKYEEVIELSNFRDYNADVYNYSDDFKTTGALDVKYSVANTATITATITSEFEITGADNIEVINSGDSSTSFDYTVYIEEDTETGDTKVTIEFFNLTDTNNEDGSWGDSWSIDISIPVKLVDNTKFCTDEYDFEETNVSETTASIRRERAITKDDNTLGTEIFTETATVASPKLYKYEEATPTEEPPTEEPPTEEPPTDDTPSEEPPTEDTPSEDTPSEETPSEETSTEDTPAEKTSTDGTPSEETSSPQTGDNSNIVLWVTVMLGSIPCLIGTILYSRNRKHSR